MRNIHHLTCSVIPPHIQQHVAKHGDDDAREGMKATMRQTARIAQDRAHSPIDTPNGPTALTLKRREVFDGQHKRSLPGKLVMDDRGASTNDIEAVEAFDGSGAVWDFFAKVCFRNSIDGKGMPIISTVHYGRNFDNAMWDGKQMIYGDGDGKLFNRFTIDLDVIGHEETHGVTQHSKAALEYHDQPGALNEHISDAFGMMIKQYFLGQTVTQSDWLIGKGILGPNVHGQALRSMKAPGTAYDDPVLGRDPQPAHMRDYVVTTDDNGGVHINSGILNHGFYNIAIAVGVPTWLVLTPLWYRTLTEELSPQASFLDFASATVSVAGRLFGSGSAVQTAVIWGWSQVGLLVPALVTPRTAPRSNRTKWRDRPLARPKS